MQTICVDIEHIMLIVCCCGY